MMYLTVCALTGGDFGSGFDFKTFSSQFPTNALSAPGPANARVQIAATKANRRITFPFEANAFKEHTPFQLSGHAGGRRAASARQDFHVLQSNLSLRGHLRCRTKFVWARRCSAA